MTVAVEQTLGGRIDTDEPVSIRKRIGRCPSMENAAKRGGVPAAAITGSS